MKGKRFILYFLPALLVTLAIFYLSTRGIEASNAQSGEVTEKVISLFGKIEVIDDTGTLSSMSFNGTGLDYINLYIRALAHVCEFGGLGLMIGLGSYLCQFTDKKRIKLTLCWGAVVALLDEILQYFVPGRTCSIMDIGKDLVGILLSILAIYLLKTIWNACHQYKKLA